MAEDTGYNRFLDKRLLVITPIFPNENGSYFGGIFVKDQLDALKCYFQEIIVIAPILFSAGLLPEDKLCRDYSYDNVRVFFPRSIYIPWPLYRRYNISRIFFDTRHKVVDRLIEEQNIEFDLIHAHFLRPSAYIGKKLKQRYHLPLVITAHGYDLYEVPFRDPIWQERIVSATAGADYFITVSRKNLSCFEQLNIDIPAQVIPNGYSADLFFPSDMNECRRALQLPLDKKILLSVGNLEEVKGHRYLIEAMKEIASQRSDVLCVIVGSGPLENTLKKQIAELGLEDVVILVGGRPHEEIPLWMNACDVFVLPSLKESFGVVQIEAMACGKPVVATRNGGSEEIIQQCQNGLLCSPRDPEHLAQDVIDALNIEWDLGGIIKFSNYYIWEKVSKKILEVYNRIESWWKL